MRGAGKLPPPSGVPVAVFKDATAPVRACQAAAGLNPAFIVLGGGDSEEGVFRDHFLTVPAPDNYESLTWKVLESLVAVRRRYGPVGVVKIDDDSLFETPPDHARIAELAGSADYAGWIIAGDSSSPLLARNR